MYLRVKQILEIIPVSEKTWYRWIKEGRVPAGKLIGPRVRVWDAAQIHELASSVGVAQ